MAPCCALLYSAYTRATLFEIQILFPLESSAPSLRFTRIPNDDVLHSGENVTLLCNSSRSKFDSGSLRAAYPYLVQIIHGRHIARQCGGRFTDSAAVKTCTVEIANVNASHSGDWACRAENMMACTFSSLTLKIKGNLPRSHKCACVILAGPRVVNATHNLGNPVVLVVRQHSLRHLE